MTIRMLAAAALAAAVATPYSLRDNMISDLGAVSCTQIAYPAGPVEVCSPWNPLLNGAFIAFGLITCILSAFVSNTATVAMLMPTALGILAVIAKIGTGGGQGYVLEYRGSAIRDLSMEGRMTICNMSIEAGARAGLRGRPSSSTTRATS